MERFNVDVDQGGCGFNFIVEAETLYDAHFPAVQHLFRIGVEAHLVNSLTITRL